MSGPQMFRSGFLGLALALSAAPGLAQAEEGVAVLAGGCFWCIEHDLEKLDGVKDVVSGYAGGPASKANYKAVSTGRSGHIEVVEVRFDPAVITYAQLLDVFWREVDPTDGGGQFCDRGPQYRTAIFALDDEQAEIAKASKAALDASGWLPAPIATEILPAAEFYEAEAGHQDYAERNSLRYRYYRLSCGRDKRIDEVWKNAPPLDDGKS